MLILAAVSMTVLGVLVSFMVNASHAYDLRTRLSGVADNAAQSAAIEIYRGTTNSTALRAFAQLEVDKAVADGIIPATTVLETAQTCDVSTTPCAYASAGYYEVVLRAPSDNLFSNYLSALTARSRAVAGQSTSPACITVLGPGSPAFDLGNTRVNAPNCTVAIGGGLTCANGNSSIISDGISAASAGGNCDSTDFPHLVTPAAAPTDPLSTLAAPTIGTTSTYTSGTLNAGTYQNVTISGNVSLGSGTVIIKGTLTFNNNSSLTGTANNFLYLGPSASVSFGQHVSLTMVAPTSGTYAGIAIFQDRANTTTFSVANNSDMDITGTIYIPSATLEAGNSLGNNGNCTMLVVKKLDIGNGNGLFNFDNTCSDVTGGSPLHSVAVAE